MNDDKTAGRREVHGEVVRERGRCWHWKGMRMGWSQSKGGIKLRSGQTLERLGEWVDVRRVLNQKDGLSSRRVSYGKRGEIPHPRWNFEDAPAHVLNHDCST